VFLLNGNKALISQVTNFLISTHAVVRKSGKLYNSADNRGKGTVPKYDNDQAEDSYRGLQNETRCLYASQQVIQIPGIQLKLQTGRIPVTVFD
jgi:hypothetical protein